MSLLNKYKVWVGCLLCIAGAFGGSLLVANYNRENYENDHGCVIREGAQPLQLYFNKEGKFEGIVCL